MSAANRYTQVRPLVCSLLKREERILIESQSQEICRHVEEDRTQREDSSNRIARR